MSDFVERVIKKGSHPNSLKNLKKFDADGARKLQEKSVQSRLLNKQIQEEFKISAKNFQKVMEDLPKLSALDVMRMCMHMALQKDNYEDAARYANMITEYENPKLQRIEKTSKVSVNQLSDEELEQMIKAEGLDE